MQYARLNNGKLVTLAEFLDSVKAALPAGQVLGKGGWSVRVCCPDCAAPVHPYDINAGLGFKMAAQEVGVRTRARAQPGFHHHDQSAAADCPQNFSKDPRFQELSKHKFDGRIAAEVAAELAKPEVQNLNKRVLAALLRRLRGKWPEQDEVNNQTQAAARKLKTMVILKTHPWLLPYLWVRMLGHQTAQAKNGRTYHTTFVLGRSRDLSFADADGETRTAHIPEMLIAAFVNGKGHNRPYTHMTKGIVEFPLTKAAAYALARPMRGAEAKHAPKKPVAKRRNRMSGVPEGQASFFDLGLR